jgi:hypothetical protein
MAKKINAFKDLFGGKKIALKSRVKMTSEPSR